MTKLDEQVRAAYSRDDGDLGVTAVAELAGEAVPVEADDCRAALQAVIDGHADLAVVWFDDSVIGTNDLAFDFLVFEGGTLVITAEVDIERTVDGRPATRRFVKVRPFTEELLAGLTDPETLLFVVPGFNRPGTLTEALASLSSRGINITKVDALPLSGDLGMYGFLIEFEGTPTDPLVREAMADVLLVASTIKYLGSFSVSTRRWGQVVGRQILGNVLSRLADIEQLGGQEPT